MPQTLELLALLYELSLSNVKHSQPEEISRKFIKTILMRKNLHYGAVWRITDFDHEKLTLKKIFSLPNVPVLATIDIDKFVDAFSDNNFYFSCNSLLNEQSIKGNYIYFKLSDFGILELLDTNKSEEEFSEESFFPFTDVMTQLGVSLESGLSYQALQEEIKQRQVAERSLKTNEAKYRRIVENIKLGLLEVDNEERITHANLPFLEMVGYQLHEITGYKASDIFLRDVDDQFREEMHRQNEFRKDNKSSSYEMLIKNKSGEKKWLIISGSANFDKYGNQIGSIGIHLDITKQKKLIEENKVKESRLQKIFESSLDAMVSVDTHCNIIEWNPQAQNIFGYAMSEVLGVGFEEIISKVPTDDDQTNVISRITNLEKEVFYTRIELLGIRKNGESFPVELTLFPIEHEDNLYATAFIRDITELKKSRESMEKALERQKELNSLKSQFISMTSHELRTPLTTIRSNTELITFRLENSDKIDPEKLLKNVTRIDYNVDRLNQLINNILLIGKLDSNKVPFNPEATDLLSMIANTILPNLSDPSRPVQCHKKGTPYQIRIDRKLFLQILTNLLENALKYSPGAPPPELYLTYEEDEVKIDVKDHGLGIPETELPKLFETFFRASNVGNIQGTGLGLAIVKEFVNLHKGTIEVQSKVNEGTIFTIKFPKS